MPESFAPISDSDWPAVDRAIDAALEEDVGPGDVTTLWTVRENATARADLIAKAEGVIAGLEVAARVFQKVDARIVFTLHSADGDRVVPRDRVAEVAGPARGILTAERTALNFLQRLSGIATATADCVALVEGTGARVLDTRKTAPGLRALDKYAVRAGGGVNHRVGLFDMALIKDNHIEAADGIASAVRRVRSGVAQENRTLKVEVEVRNLDELREALACRVDRIMLDNMDIETMREAVRIARASSDCPEIEASGGVTPETLRAVAETGVDFISLGALTHSVKALDISLMFR
ncbi:carboxylating nicotinate-nucleotide diphosphorylase [bacterium]|nr:carboxylating nicotinate-nucleotide diphosphorylase [bacterium]